MALGPVALVGFGRFGGALGELLRAAQVKFTAFDPYREPPPEVRAASLGAAVSGAKVVVLAVPLGQLEASARLVAPYLKPGTLVLDACSVKVKAMALMEAALPNGVRWTGTHPLFGPTTLALKEKPLRAVVCPAPGQEAAAAEARAFFEALGCEVLEQSAEAHDRCMAESHLAACFIAEGLIAAGFRTEHPFVTPSYRSLERVMNVVASEADHLRAAVYQSNPFGAAARERLLVALEAIDRSLEAPSPELRGQVATRPLPGDPEHAKTELVAARAEIDELDQELVSLLARRAALAKHIVELKAVVGQGVLDTAREESLFRTRRVWASALGLDADAVEQIFRSVLEFSRGVQHASLKQK